jgi:FAD/FMN-containing dehydrogenase
MSASKLCSWGHYPPAPQIGDSVRWRDEIQRSLANARTRNETTLPYGNGRSYGDSCLAATDRVIYLGKLNRFIDADWTSGVLRAEAGVTLGEVLSVAVARGWMLPVTPGTQFATLGGAVANDVHGKNHHLRGTFGRHVRRFSLLRSDRPRVECACGENDALFRATIGGLGLTGVIEWIEIQLMPIRSSCIALSRVRFGNLSEFFALSDAFDREHEYGVAWVDCLGEKQNLGRGVYFSGDHATDNDFSTPGRRKHRVPFTPPCSPVNRYTLKAFNAFYFGRQPRQVEHGKVDFERFFYPLDAIQDWNRLYGRRGFQQYQCVVPEATASDSLTEILSTISRSGTGSFLAVLKRCGGLVSPGLLSFPMPGTSLALDFPQRDQRNEALFSRLDAIVRQAGGRQYPAKDAHMSSEDFRAAYPQWHELERQRDPALMSRFWKRTTHS